MDRGFGKKLIEDYLLAQDLTHAIDTFDRELHSGLRRYGAATETDGHRL